MKPKFAKIVDNRDPSSLSAALRRKRFGMFLALVADLPRPIRLLDVGGEARFWEVMGATGLPDFEITLYNLQPASVLHPGYTYLQGDAADLGRFSDGEFDVVFSNSVIEHLGSFGRQQQMAAGVQRAGQRYFIQTPNRNFPIEPHFLVPFFQFLPRGVQIWLVRHFNLGWYRRIPEWEPADELVRAHRLLNAAEVRRLFPHAHIFCERFCGLTKSFIAYGSR